MTFQISELFIERPHISEKGGDLRNLGQYVFVVSKKANKDLVKKAVESIFKVKVEKVRIINLPGKRKRLGKTEGWRSGYKKAIVTLKRGEKIETE
ncbi:MAG: 50S ribosomal protein L23 [Parcubacteria group bacterium]|nr:50S ribosomal protein L23 [Parcubacteria group bacterium]